MIVLHPRLVELLNQDIVEGFTCVQIKDLRITTYFTGLNLSDGYYTPSDLITAVDEPQLTSTVDRDLYKIQFTDSRREFFNQFEVGLNGAPVNVQIGFVDQSTGLPETDYLFIMYKGIVESFSYDIDTAENGSILATITCSNPMATLDGSNPYYTSKFAIQQLDSSDTSFDQIYEGSGGVLLKWGKK